MDCHFRFPRRTARAVGSQSDKARVGHLWVARSSWSLWPSRACWRQWFPWASWKQRTAGSQRAPGALREERAQRYEATHFFLLEGERFPHTDFATVFSWSSEFAVFTNRKVTGLKVSYVSCGATLDDGKWTKILLIWPNLKAYNDFIYTIFLLLSIASRL